MSLESNLYATYFKLESYLREVRVGIPEMPKQKALHYVDIANTWVGNHSFEIMTGCFVAGTALMATLAYYASREAAQWRLSYEAQADVTDHFQDLYEEVDASYTLYKEEMEEVVAALNSSVEGLKEGYADLQATNEELESDLEDARHNADYWENESDIHEERAVTLEDKVDTLMEVVAEYKAMSETTSLQLAA